MHKVSRLFIVVVIIGLFGGFPTFFHSLTLLTSRRRSSNLISSSFFLSSCLGKDRH